MGLLIVHGLPVLDEPDQPGLVGVGRVRVLDAARLLPGPGHLVLLGTHEPVPLFRWHTVVAGHDDQRDAPSARVVDQASIPL